MAIEIVSEMPTFESRTRKIFRELISCVNSAKAGQILKYKREDGKKLNTSTIRKIIEDATGKCVRVKGFDDVTAFIEVLNADDVKKEMQSRQLRSVEMKKKLKGEKTAKKQ